MAEEARGGKNRPSPRNSDLNLKIRAGPIAWAAWSRDTRPSGVIIYQD
jgi:hypothetical protein